MDYAQQRRLKIWGRAQLVHEEDKPQLINALQDPAYRAPVERAVIIQVEAYEWNCPQHITPRYTESEINQLVESLREENNQLKNQLTQLSQLPTAPPKHLVNERVSLEPIAAGGGIKTAESTASRGARANAAARDTCSCFIALVAPLLNYTEWFC